MKAQYLKHSVLQLAVQGKIVEQNPADEPAVVLLQKIKAEKARLVKEKIIKADKPLPAISEDEIPFEIPESWAWCRLSDVLDVRDGTHDTPKYVSEGYPLVTSKNLDNGELNFSNIKFISEDDYISINQRSCVDDGDILFAMIGSIGNPVLVRKDRDFAIKNVALFKTFSFVNTSIKYVYMFLLYAQETMKKVASGGVQSFVSLSFLREYFIPIPPIAEQQRIVEKINELQPMIDKYNIVERELNALNNRFPDDLKKSVLQYAVQGKLVEQNPEDEPADVLLEKIKAEKTRLVKEKKIKADKVSSFIFKGEDGSYYENIGGEIKCIDDEIPFEIPESWVWVRIGDLAKKIGAGSTPTGGNSVYSTSGIKFIRSQNVYDDGLRLDKIAYISDKINQAKKGSIVQA
ncbi:MAG: restriction endonuclease subunit S, partial [Eubacteriales bacterium]